MIERDAQSRVATVEQLDAPDGASGASGLCRTRLHLVPLAAERECYSATGDSRHATR